MKPVPPLAPARAQEGAEAIVPLAMAQWWAKRWFDNASADERQAMRDLLA